MNARKLTLSILVLVCALAFWSVPAQAATTHEYLFQFGEVPAEGPLHEKVALPGPLPEEGSLVVDSGQLWIAGQISGTSSFSVDRFNAATGAFTSQFAHSENDSPEYINIAVAHPAGQPESQIYLSEYDNGPLLGVYSESGTREATWTGAETPAKSWGYLLSGLAVDNSTSLTDWAAGDLYVADTQNKVVDVFHPEVSGQEKYVTQLTGTSPSEPFTAPSSVAVNDLNGDVVVADNGKVDLFEPTTIGEEYTFVRTLTPPGATSFASVPRVNADDGEGDIYVADSEGVFEFDSAGDYVGKIAVGAEAVAADPTTHRVFPASRGLVQAYGPNIVVPDVTTGAVSSLHAKRATLNGTVNPDGQGEAKCQFEWGTSSSFGKVAPCEPEGVAEGSSPAPVHAILGGLHGDTTYYYRLRASNGPKGANPGGTNPGEASQDQQFTTPGPRVEQSTTDVAGTSATLDATINPHGVATTYYFQYGTSTSYGASAPAAPGLGVGSGESDVSVSAHLDGLLLGTQYHYRVVALSVEPGGEPVSEEGPDETFTTQPVASGGSGLLDGRRWELVSPTDKHGGLICPVGCEGVTKAALSGGAFTYKMSAPPEAEPGGYTELLDTQMLATRGPSGWVSRDISIPHESPTGESVGEGSEYRVFSEDLSLAVVQPFGPFVPSLSAEASEQTPFLRTNFLNGDPHDLCAESCYRPLVTGKPGYANVPPGTRFGTYEEGGSNVSGCPPQFLHCGPEFLAATPDLRHIAISSFAALTGGEPRVQEYEWTDGHLSPGNHLSSYRPPAPAGGPWEYASSCPEHAPEEADCDLTVSHGGATKTVAVTVGADRNIWEASPDGRWLAFMSQRSLTGYDNRDAVSGKPDEEVYLYHAPEDLATEAGQLVCASCDPSGARPIGKEFHPGEAGIFSNFYSGGLSWGEGQGIAANITETEKYKLCCSTGYQPRYISNSGRLFFDSSDALVPQDVNGGEDAYEYELPGVGDCTTANPSYSERSRGCVGLVSSGGAVGESAFLDASESGADVFIMTYGKLTPQDYGTDLDVYDAHECSSSSPCTPAPPVPPPPCTTGDACKPSPSPQPATFGAPASQTFSGAGNVTPRPPVVTKKAVKCPKGKKRGHGTCVKAKAKHRNAKAKRRNSHKAKKATTNRRAGR